MEWLKRLLFGKYTVWFYHGNTLSTKRFKDIRKAREFASMFKISRVYIP